MKLPRWDRLTTDVALIVGVIAALGLRERTGCPWWSVVLLAAPWALLLRLVDRYELLARVAGTSRVRARASGRR